MNSPCLKSDPSIDVAALEQRIAKLECINQALMDRVERDLDMQGNAFSLFQAAIVLETRVSERTAELTHLNEALKSEIEERTLIEEKLRVAKAEAEQANVSKTKFLAASSHDLLQPLNAARLFVSALVDMDHAGPAEDLTHKVDNALASVEDLLNVLLDISKLDAGVVKPDIVDFEIRMLTGVLVTEHSSMAEEADIELRHVPSAAVVRSDIQLLRRIVQNFISNAIRYTQDGRVLIGCRRRKTGLRIEVWDTGVGIEQSMLSEIFDEFRRLESAVRSDDSGVGLGLAIVRRVARVLNHRIDVVSVPGWGSMFAVEVPYGDPANIKVHKVAERDVPVQPLDGAEILVVDNDPRILAGMEALLGRWSCKVVSAASRREVLAALNSRAVTPNLIIADYHLDGEFGIDAISDVVGFMGKRVPAIVITADRSEALHARVRNAGYYILTKPIKPAKMRALISRELS